MGASEAPGNAIGNSSRFLTMSRDEEALYSGLWPSTFEEYFWPPALGQAIVPAIVDRPNPIPESEPVLDDSALDGASFDWSNIGGSELSSEGIDPRFMEVLKMHAAQLKSQLTVGKDLELFYYRFVSCITQPS